MKDSFFSFAVVGPTASHRMGIAAGCEDCREHQAQAPRCEGFGAGCIGFRAPSREERDRADE